VNVPRTATEVARTAVDQKDVKRLVIILRQEILIEIQVVIAMIAMIAALIHRLVDAIDATKMDILLEVN